MLKNPRKKAAKAANEDLSPEAAKWLEELQRVASCGGFVIGLAGALERLDPENLDEALIDEVLGHRVLTSREELAMEFGVGVGEIAEWERQGMPTRDTAAAPSDARGAAPKSEFFPPNARTAELLRALRIRRFDAAALTILLGGQIFAASQPEIAKAFGVSIGTVKVWAASGMPKPAKTGDPYSLPAILHWRTREDERADEQQRRRF